MRDRLKRSENKKSNLKLKRVSIIGGVVALCSTIALTVSLVNINMNNSQLTNNINDYNEKVNNYKDVQSEEITKIQLNRK